MSQAESAGAFCPLPFGRVKPDGLRLLELCLDPEKRSAAVNAMRWVQERRENETTRLVEALVGCGEDLGGTRLCEDHASWMDQAAPVQESELRWQQELVRASRTPVDLFSPAHTEAGLPSRNPWDGFLGQITFGELSAGFGMFAACFEAAGAVCSYVMEPADEMRERAVRACSQPVRQFRSMMDVDPSDLPWTHLLVAGTECQPFSKRGRRAAWDDDRAYTLIRAIHIAAVQQPWMCWFENVANILTLHGGRVLQAIEGMVAAAGFVLRIERA